MSYANPESNTCSYFGGTSSSYSASRTVCSCKSDNQRDIGSANRSAAARTSGVFHSIQSCHTRTYLPCDRFINTWRRTSCHRKYSHNDLQRYEDTICELPFGTLDRNSLGNIQRQLLQLKQELMSFDPMWIGRSLRVIIIVSLVFIQLMMERHPINLCILHLVYCFSFILIWQASSAPENHWQWRSFPLQLLIQTDSC